MEPFYYNKMNKLQQAVYHGMLQGINALEFRDSDSAN